MLRPLWLLVALGFGLVANAAYAASETRPLNVVVSSKPIHALVAEVMKGVGTPKLIVDGAQSPHSFVMRPSDAQKLSQADVFFRVSEALEPFTAKLVRALPPNVTVSTLAEAPGVNLLQRRAGGPFEIQGHRHSHGARKHATDASHDAYDAHVWLDPDNAKAMVRAIAATLAQRDASRADRFEANATALAGRLDALKASLRAELAPLGQRPFVVLHDAYQYFERSFGLNAIGSIFVDPDEQPSAKRIADLRRKVSDLSAVCIFAEPNHQPKIVASVTEGTPARMAMLDPEGITIESGPDLYFRLMQQLATAMKQCLAAAA